MSESTQSPAPTANANGSTDAGPPPAPAPESAKKRGRPSKPAAEPLPEDTVSPTPDPVPPPPPKVQGARRIKSTELIVMNDCWELMADMPPSVQRRIVNWLDSQVVMNEHEAANHKAPDQE